MGSLEKIIIGLVIGTGGFVFLLNSFPPHKEPTAQEQNEAKILSNRNESARKLIRSCSENEKIAASNYIVDCRKYTFKDQEYICIEKAYNMFCED